MVRVAMGFPWFLVIGVVAGWLAGTFVKRGGFGRIGDLIVGALGAVVLLFIVRRIKRA